KNAELGFLSLSQIIKDEKKRKKIFWLVPIDLYSPIEQQVVLLNKAKNDTGAKDFFKFLKSERALQIIRSYGYKVQKGER
ncbi:MAG: substrate-binding domain-containing protein, partial [Bdellovibrionales bacterium]|nr:substrate-binding domain-containing protein [Bdellovibrionales bacterium]